MMDFTSKYYKALLNEWCAINGIPDIDMYLYLVGKDFALDRMKKAK